MRSNKFDTLIRYWKASKVIFVSTLLQITLLIGDTFYRRSYRIQDLLPVQFQQIYYNDVATTAHFYAYDM